MCADCIHGATKHLLEIALIPLFSFTAFEQEWDLETVMLVLVLASKDV